MMNRAWTRTGACVFKRKVGLIVGAALVSVALVACGDSDSPVAVGASFTPAPPPTVTDTAPSTGGGVPAENGPTVAGNGAAAGGDGAVVAAVPGTTTLSWTPPTLNADGTPLSLTGYRIYWGQQRGYYTSSVTVQNPGLTRYVVEQLEPATWYFVATALSPRGESDFSNEIVMRVL